MDVLAKSLSAVEATEPGWFEKMLGMGPASPGQADASLGPQTGMGAGRVLTGQSLESKGTPPRVVESGKKPKNEGDEDEDEDEKKIKKALTKAEASAWVHARLPGATLYQIGRFIEATCVLKRTGKL